MSSYVDCYKLYDQIQKEAESRLRHLTSAEGELSKFEEELTRYNNWLDTAEDSLRGLQRSVGDLAKLFQQREQQKVRAYIEPGIKSVLFNTTLITMLFTQNSLFSLS